MRHAIWITALLLTTLAGIAAPSASAAPLPGRWCGEGESAADRFPDAVASYQVRVVYAIPSDGTLAGPRPVCRVAVDTVRSVTATFARSDYRLTATLRGSGTMRSAPAGIRCPSSCSVLFKYGKSFASLPGPPPVGSSRAGAAAAAGKAPAGSG